MNVERYAGPTTLVVIDDIYPCHPAQAARRRRTGTWTGDVWKLHQILREHRPDLLLLALNAHPTGVLVVAGLDPANRVLWERYDTLARSLRADRPPPSSVLDRRGAIPSAHPVLDCLLARLQAARVSNWDRGQVRQMLQTEFQEWLQWLVSEFSARSAREAAEITMPPPAGRLADRPFAQLYLPQADDMGFTELASIKSELSPGQWQDLLFKLPESSARVGGSPRFDPVNRAGLVQIDQLCLMDLVSDTVLFSLTNPDMEAAFHLAGDASPCQEQGIFTLYALGDDPQVFLPAIPRLNAGNVDLALHVRLRFIADSAELRDQWTANCNQRTEEDAEAVPYQLPEARSTGTETEYGQSTALMPESSSLSVSADAVGSIAWLEQQLDEKLTLLAGFERRQVG